MDLQRLASTLLGKKRAETNTVMTDATTRTYVGTATSTSEDGSVYVELSEDVTLPDDDDGTHGLGVEMPTTVNVDEGDEVIVTVFGGGTMKAPVVTGNPGWGDRIQTQVDNAETLAQQADAVATATGQHFWTGDDGVHVTEVTQEDWNDEESPDYHSGANVLLNALGQLFRDAMNNLMALTAGAAYTETFEIRSDDQNQYTLTNKPMTVDSVTIDNVATDDYLWLNYDMLEGGTGGGTVVLGSETWYDNPGATLSVTYHTSPALTVYDGLGNLAANIQSYFTATEIGLGGNIYEDMAHKWWQTASVRFFGANGNRGASLEAGYSYNADESNINWDDTLGLGGTISDAEAPTVNGCVSESGVDTHRWLYDDTESSDNYRAESTANLYAHSHGGDGYYGADATARLGVKTVTVGDSYAQSYITLGDGTGEDGEWSMQSIITLLDSLFDTWHVGTFSSPFSNYDGLAQNAPRWRKFGNVVEFHGIATVTSQQTAGNRKLFTLPDGYRPTGITRYAGIMQGSNMNRFLLRVNTGGEVYMERYGTTSDSAIPANAWLTLTGLFMI